MEHLLGTFSFLLSPSFNFIRLPLEIRKVIYIADDGDTGRVDGERRIAN